LYILKYNANTIKSGVKRMSKQTFRSIVSALLILFSTVYVSVAHAYVVSIDEFTITKNGNPFWADDFNDDVLPSTADYVISGTIGPESNGRLTLDSSGAVPFTGATGASLLRQRVLKRSSTDPTNNFGLRSDDTFAVNAIFDLSAPSVLNEFYGITLIDGTGGVPGNDNVQIIVRRTLADTLRIQFRAVDFMQGTVTLLEQADLNLSGSDQISLTLSRLSNTGPISASYAYGLGGVFGLPTSFTATKTIFNGEDFTRAQFQAVTPIPLPAAIWLFGSGLLGLIGISRRKRAA
jgi:hypothetical protein